MKIILLILCLAPISALAQYSSGNNQLQYVSGVQVKEDGEVIYNKKKWNLRRKKKENIVVVFNDEKILTNDWNEGSIKIPKKKNKIEIKYKDLKAKDLEIEYVFQGAREEKNDVTSLTNFKDQKVINFTQCVGKKCLTLTEGFCAELSKNIGVDKADALAKANQCMSFSGAMGNFNPSNPLISDLKKVHFDNLGSIDNRLSDYFEYESKLNESNEFELATVIQQGKENQEYFKLLIKVLTSCEKNF
jgi:hypothetical protein